jgi:large subunit ribosomal protein L1
MDVAKAVQDQKAGMVNYRTDKDGNVHMPIGRVSFEEAALADNFNAVKDLILRVKPATAKGTYVKNVVISSTMGPSIKVAL